MRNDHWGRRKSPESLTVTGGIPSLPKLGQPPRRPAVLDWRLASVRQASPLFFVTQLSHNRCCFGIVCRLGACHA